MRTISAAIVALLVALGLATSVSAQGIVIKRPPEKKAEKKVERKVETKVLLRSHEGEPQVIDLGDGRQAMIVIESDTDAEEGCEDCELEVDLEAIDPRQGHLRQTEDDDEDEIEISIEIEGLGSALEELIEEIDLDDLGPMIGLVLGHLGDHGAHAGALHDLLLHRRHEDGGHSPVLGAKGPEAGAARDCPCQCSKSGPCAPTGPATGHGMMPGPISGGRIAAPGAGGRAAGKAPQQHRIIARRLATPNEAGQGSALHDRALVITPEEQQAARRFILKRRGDAGPQRWFATSDGKKALGVSRDEQKTARRFILQRRQAGAAAAEAPRPGEAPDLGRIEERLERLAGEMQALQAELRALRRKI